MLLPTTTTPRRESLRRVPLDKLEIYSIYKPSNMYKLYTHLSKTKKKCSAFSKLLFVVGMQQH